MEGHAHGQFPCKSSLLLLPVAASWQHAHLKSSLIQLPKCWLVALDFVESPCVLWKNLNRAQYEHKQITSISVTWRLLFGWYSTCFDFNYDVSCVSRWFTNASWNVVKASSLQLHYDVIAVEAISPHSTSAFNYITLFSPLNNVWFLAQNDVHGDFGTVAHSGFVCGSCVSIQQGAAYLHGSWYCCAWWTHQLIIPFTRCTTSPGETKFVIHRVLKRCIIALHRCFQVWSIHCSYRSSDFSSNHHAHGGTNVCACTSGTRCCGLDAWFQESSWSHTYIHVINLHAFGIMIWSDLPRHSNAGRTSGNQAVHVVLPWFEIQKGGAAGEVLDGQCGNQCKSDSGTAGHSRLATACISTCTGRCYEESGVVYQRDTKHERLVHIADKWV